MDTQLSVGTPGATFALRAFQPAAAGAETLKIGVIAPLTGGGAPWGMAAAEAPRIHAAEINAKGGLDAGRKKYTVQVVAHVDQYKAASAVAAFNRPLRQDPRYMFRIYSTAAADYLPSLTGWLKVHQKAATATMVNPNDETGWDQSQRSEKVFRSQGFQILGRDLKRSISHD